MTRHAGDADDIVQDAFCRLLRADVEGLNDEELRRYIFRTRMIYNFDYEDWAPKP